MSDPDKTPPPQLSPELTLVLERINGLESSIQAGFRLLQADINGVVDGSNTRHAAVMTELATIKDTQAKHTRVLTWLRKGVGDLVDGFEEFRREYVAFQEHVFAQFQRTPSLRVVESMNPDEQNGNGTHGE